MDARCGNRGTVRHNTSFGIGEIMNIYKVNVELQLEQRSNFDKHDFRKSDELEFEHEDIYNGIHYHMRGKNDIYSIEIDNILATDDAKCFEKIECFLDRILPVASLLVQFIHCNQHYSHLRFNYRKSGIHIVLIQEQHESVITTEEEGSNTTIKVKSTLNIRSSIFMKSRITVKFDNLNKVIELYDENPEFKFIMDCYYRALASNDSVTKFYNAFSVIEFIEATFKDEVNTSELIASSVYKDFVSHLDEFDGFLPDQKNRILSRVGNTLKNATLESRAEKLLALMSEYFEIEKVSSGSIEMPVTLDSMKELIGIRNSLYHSKQFSEDEYKDLFDKGLKLVLLTQEILNWFICQSNR